MLPIKYIPFVLKQVIRHRTRTLLTLCGVSVAMFLFCTVHALSRGVSDATEAVGNETTLIVYRANRFCPFTSRMPEHYTDRIRRIAGVTDVVPTKIIVNNCRASLDVVTFRGIPPEQIGTVASGVQVLEGSLDDFAKRSDAALLGETLARRRGLRAGQAFESSGVPVHVAAIIRSSEPQNQNVAYVKLDYLQRTLGKQSVGIVTQFTVKVSDASQLERVAQAIDAEFKNDPDPTSTRPEKAFVARAAQDIIEIVSFTRVLAWGCLAAVLALVANAIVLSVQDRVKEHAVLRTIGFRSGLIARLIVAEGVIMGVAGGTIGTLLAFGLIRFGNFTLTIEGVSMSVTAGLNVILAGLVISASLGVLAGLVPAWQASRREIAACFRAV